MVAANQNHAYLFLSLLQARVGSSLMRRIPGGETGSLLQRSAPELAREMKLGEKATRALADLAEGFDAAAVLDRLRRKGFRAVTYADEAYPARRRVVPDPPPALFVGGELGEGLSVAIVGSRRASRSGLETAEVLGRALAARGACRGERAGRGRRCRGTRGGARGWRKHRRRARLRHRRYVPVRIQTGSA